MKSINSKLDERSITTEEELLKHEATTSRSSSNTYYSSGSPISTPYKIQVPNLQGEDIKNSSTARVRLPLLSNSLFETYTVNWLSECIHRLESLRKLQKNWNSYDSEPPNSTALYWGRVVIEILTSINFPPLHISASAEEGINISFICDEKYADIECLNTGEILAVNSNRRDHPDVWQVNPRKKDIKHSLEKIRAYLES